MNRKNIVVIFLFSVFFKSASIAQNALPQKVINDFIYWLSIAYVDNQNTELFVYRVFEAKSRGDVEETFLYFKENKSIQNKVFKNIYNNLGNSMERNFLSIGMPSSSSKYLADYIGNIWGEEDKKNALKQLENEKADEKNSEESEKKTEELVTETPYTIVEQMPTFPGGNEQMNKFIKDHLLIPKKKERIKGKSYVTFVVEKDGKLTGVKTLKKLQDCEECDIEALRVVNLMPLWRCGKQNGREVRVMYNLPVEFK